MSKLTSRDMLEGAEWMQDECVEGYRDARRDAPWPGSNRSPFYIHGFNCGKRDAHELPPIPMHEIVATWNLIVMAGADA